MASLTFTLRCTNKPQPPNNYPHARKDATHEPTTAPDGKDNVVYGVGALLQDVVKLVMKESNGIGIDIRIGRRKRNGVPDERCC